MKGINEESLRLLEKCVMIHNPKLISWISSENLYRLKPNQYNELRSLVNDEFLVEGIDKNYEPNEYGLRLENLIDELGRLFM
ncbi:hypothetical protein ERUR111494_05335 [Erysipelothrix urinaevulpis]|uniref:hypothetical protein n=1 Tax=Erysipelothrix urinaevulpis TaxID=2683717 RepID=UPI001356D9E5|nr:hypothetical protein [Erysipelothrix urinaevulpis]